MSRLQKGSDGDAFEGIAEPGQGPCECARLVEDYKNWPIQHRKFPNKAGSLMALRTLTWCMGYKPMDSANWMVVISQATGSGGLDMKEHGTVRCLTFYLKNFCNEDDAKTYALAYAQDYMGIELPVMIACTVVLDADDYESKVALFKQSGKFKP